MSPYELVAKLLQFFGKVFCKKSFLGDIGLFEILFKQLSPGDSSLPGYQIPFSSASTRWSLVTALLFHSFFSLFSTLHPFIRLRLPKDPASKRHLLGTSSLGARHQKVLLGVRQGKLLAHPQHVNNQNAQFRHQKIY